MLYNGHRSLNILVVDDCRDFADSLALYLTLQGYQVTTSYSPEEAFAKVQGSLPEVVVLDLKMPGEDGWQLAQRILPLYPVKPLLLAVSGCGTLEDLRRSQEAGFTCHLTKPFDPKIISRLITCHLTGNGRPAGVEPDWLTCSRKAGRRSTVTLCP